MQTRTYGDLFKITSALIGTGGELAAGEQNQLGHLINRRFQQAFDESPVWPRYLVSSEARDIYIYNISGITAGQHTHINQNYKLLGLAEPDTVSIGGTNVYSGLSSSDTLIYKNTSNAWVIATGVTNSVNSAGEVVFGDAGTAKFTEEDTVKKESIEEVVTWGQNASSVGPPIIVSQSLIPYDQAGKESIGEFNRVHRNRAFMNRSSVEYDFFVDFYGANILNIANSTGNEVFVSYKKQFTPFTVTSDYYTSTVEVPAEFFNYIAHAVYADFLRVQNRQDQALIEEQVAQNYLSLELEKIDVKSNNNTINKRFSTYVNRQSR